MFYYNGELTPSVLKLVLNFNKADKSLALIKKINKFPCLTGELKKKRATLQYRINTSVKLVLNAVLKCIRGYLINIYLITSV